MKLLRRTWADVDLDRLAHNYKEIRNTVHPGAKIMGIMKADAYGHGAVPMSHALVDLGVDFLAVSNIEEAVQIRRGEVRAPILILGHTPPSYAETMIFMGISQEIHSLEYARELDAQLHNTNYRLNVHVKLDTGMSRIGFFAYDNPELQKELEELSRLQHLHIEGVFTHFCASDSKDPEDLSYTALQYQRFQEAIACMHSVGIQPEIRHCSNSGATILHPEYAMDMVRPGILLYGIAPSRDTRSLLDLQPVMTLKTTVAQVRRVPRGTAVSYGRDYKADRDFIMAVLPVGYADGLSRRLSDNCSLLLCDKRVPIIGRICMDMCMIDASEVPDVKVGDEVTIFGSAITCEELAERSGTIAYEVLCGINKRIPRIYLSGGNESKILQYIV